MNFSEMLKNFSFTHYLKHFYFIYIVQVSYFKFISLKDNNVGLFFAQIMFQNDLPNLRNLTYQLQWAQQNSVLWLLIYHLNGSKNLQSTFHDRNRKDSFELKFEAKNHIQKYTQTIYKRKF